MAVTTRNKILDYILALDVIVSNTHSSLYNEFSIPYKETNITFDTIKESDNDSLTVERLIFDAKSGGHMYVFDKSGSIITSKKTRISIGPMEAFFPGWILDANQVASFGTIDKVDSLLKRVMAVSHAGAKFLKIDLGQIKHDKIDGILMVFATKVKKIQAWIKGGFSRPEGFFFGSASSTVRTILDDASGIKYISPIEKEFIDITISNFKKIITKEKQRLSARTIAGKILELENKVGLFRIMETMDDTTIGNNISKLFEWLKYYFNVKEAGDIGIIRQIMSYLSIRHGTIARYLNEFCSKNDAISNKILYKLFEYFTEGNATAATSIREREITLMPLTDTQLRQLISSFRRLERKIIEDKLLLNKSLYKEDAQNMSPWIDSSKKDLRLDVAGVLYRHAMNHVIRFFGVATPYLHDKWRQDTFVLGGGDDQKIRAQILMLYSKTNPYAYEKTLDIIDQAGLNQDIEVISVVSADQDQVDQIYMKQTYPEDPDATIGTQSQDSVSHAGVVAEEEEEAKGFVVKEDECLRLIMEGDIENRISTMETTIPELCLLIRDLYNEKTSQLTLDQFKFVIHHTLSTVHRNVTIDPDIQLMGTTNVRFPQVYSPDDLIITPFHDNGKKYGFLATKNNKTYVYFSGSKFSNFNVFPIVIVTGSNEIDRTQLPLSYNDKPLYHTMYTVLYLQQIVSSAEPITSKSKFPLSLFPAPRLKKLKTKTIDRIFNYARQSILASIYTLTDFADTTNKRRIVVEDIRETLKTI